MDNTTFWVSKLTTTLTFNMAFDPNGGKTSEATRSVASGGKVGELPSATYGDKYHSGWFTSKDGGTQLSADTIVTESMRTVYAHWLDPISITWDAETNGGTLVANDYRYYPGVAFTHLPGASGTSEKPYLLGWYDNAEGSGSKLKATDLVGEGATRYYAVYTDYDDPLGSFVCTTKNMWFGTGGSDGSAVAVETVSSNWYYYDGSGGSEALTSVYLSAGSADDVFAALSSTVEGPGTLTFRAKCTSENYCDGLCFCLDGYISNFPMSYGSISSEPPSSLQCATGTMSFDDAGLFEVAVPSGEHSVYWVYTKDYSSKADPDEAWVADIRWIPS